MAFLTIAGWLFAVALAALCALTAAQQDHQAYTGALGCGCALVGTLGLLGVLPAVMAVGVAVLAALAVVGMVALTPLERDDGTPDFRGELAEARKRVAGAATGGLGAVWRAYQATRQRRQHPPDELAPRRNRTAAALPAAVPDSPPVVVPAPPPPPPPSANGRTPPMTTPPAPAAAPGIASGSVADIFAGLQTAIMRGKSQGMPGNHKTVKMLAEIHNYLRQIEESFARYMAEQGQYGSPIWEPLTQAAAYSRASSHAFGESDSALTALASMRFGDVAGSPGVRAPHHAEMNAPQ